MQPEQILYARLTSQIETPVCPVGVISKDAQPPIICYRRTQTAFERDIANTIQEATYEFEVVNFARTEAQLWTIRDSVATALDEYSASRFRFELDNEYQD